jgi:hypothetical protein
MRLRFLSTKTLLEMLAIVGCVIVLAWSVAPLLSTRPSKAAVRRWEEDYSSLLPPGYTDFRGHWQSQDVGVRIFSFRCPDGWDGERVLRHLAGRLTRFKIYEQRPGEVALRRPVTYSGPAGFDEFRFVNQGENGRIYGMFANLDSEMDVHRAVVQQLYEIAQKAQQRKK